MAKLLVIFLFLGIFTTGLIYLICPCMLKEAKVPVIEDFQWWGKGKQPVGAETKSIDPKPFKVKIEDDVLQDLKRRLSSTRYAEPLENSNFQYGFPSDQLKNVVDYWMTKFDWRKQEALINKFSHFKANIEGIDVHYIHEKPKKTEGVKVLPLLLIHGWPGSFVEFLKIIPILTTPRNGYAFEVFCPSIPGYGFSEAAHQKGFNGAVAGRLFNKLMKKFHDKYYVQGGDWGSLIGQIMAVLYPEQIRGLHLNMVTPPPMDFKLLLKYLVGSFYPSAIVDPEQTISIFPLKDFFGGMLSETGYLHIQGTKPDTVGTSLSDSPAGLAAYILEKFSTWTDSKNIEVKDGALTQKFTLDELLTNVMVYWTTNSITSSQRFYKENFSSKFRDLGFDYCLLKVPCGLAVFPNELMVISKTLIKNKFTDIVSFTHMPRGGHFAAFEEPQLLADHFLNFVEANEKKILAGDKAQ